METEDLERATGDAVLDSEDHQIGRLVGVEGDCLIVESGHLFKARYAIPEAFVHPPEETGGDWRATVSKVLVHDSPRADEGLARAEVERYYGLVDQTVADPDADLGGAEVEGVRHGVQPEPAKRLESLSGSTDLPAAARPSGLGHMPNAYAPGGTDALLAEEEHAGSK